MLPPLDQDNTHCGSPKVLLSKSNTVILEIDNLLANWPTYVLNYTPDQPGPLKIILRLKDITKLAQEDNTDTSGSDLESDCEKNGSREQVREWMKGGNITLDLASSDENNTSFKTVAIDAIPVTLHGIPKDIIPTKPKFFDDDKPWPPLRPRGLRAIFSNEPVSRFNTLKTISASIKSTKVMDSEQKHE